MLDSHPPVPDRASHHTPQSPAPWEPPSWQSIVEDHSARVYRLAYRLTGNQHDAEDLTQDVFMRVFRSLHSFTPGTFEGWLHRITTNLFLDQARRKQRIRMDSMGDDAADYPALGELSDPERGFAHANLDRDIQHALDALTPEYRAAVVLCDIEGLSYEEIAVTLSIKLGTVRSRIHRARAQLRVALAHRAPTRPGGGVELTKINPLDELAAADTATAGPATPIRPVRAVHAARSSGGAA